MKQLHNLLLSLAFICPFLFARPVVAQQAEGEIRYLIVHNWTKKMAALDYMSQQQRERKRQPDDRDRCDDDHSRHQQSDCRADPRRNQPNARKVLHRPAPPKKQPIVARYP
ncbi:MAG: hypothetical protein ABL996_27270 [Micropepsaceae bacterium]